MGIETCMKVDREEHFTEEQQACSKRSEMVSEDAWTENRG
jgi:hypothetical protein